MDLIFHATYIASKVGKTGLTVTVDVDKIERTTGTRTAVATGASATEGRNGHYYYRVASVTDLVTYDYVACFKTSDTSVDTQHIHSGWMDFPTAYDTELARLDATISSRSTYAGGDTSGVTTLLARLTSARAGYLDAINTYLDAAISSRLAAAGYTAPDNASLLLVKAKTDNLPSDPADQSDLAALLNQIIAYVDTEIAAIKAQTDKMLFDASNYIKSSPQTDVGLTPAAIADVVEAASAGSTTVNSFISIGTVDAQTLKQGALYLRTHYKFTQGFDSTIVGDLASARHVVAIKASDRDADGDAIVLIDTEPDTGDAGLRVLNGEPYGSPAHGDVVVTGESGDWHVGFLINPIAAALLEPKFNLLIEDKAWIDNEPVLVGSAIIHIVSGVVKEL